jgi:hypothetical protein
MFLMKGAKSYKLLFCLVASLKKHQNSWKYLMCSELPEKDLAS